MSDAQQPVAWVCTRRLSGDKQVFDEPCFASNPAYVKAHPDHDWTPLYVRPIQPRGAASPQGATVDAEAAKPVASSGQDNPASAALAASLPALLLQAVEALEQFRAFTMLNRPIDHPRAAEHIAMCHEARELTDALRKRIQLILGPLSDCGSNER